MESIRVTAQYSVGFRRVTKRVFTITRKGNDILVNGKKATEVVVKGAGIRLKVPGFPKFGNIFVDTKCNPPDLVTQVQKLVSDEETTNKKEEN